MKIKVLFIVLVAVLTLSLTTSSTDSDCGTFFPLKKGTKWVYNEYDKKDKLTETNTTIVKEVKVLDDKTEFIIHVKSEKPKPKKDEEPFERDLVYFCKNGVLSFDMSTFVPSEYKDMDITMEQKELEIPATLKEGQVLNDAEVTVFVNGMQMMQVNITNRKVEKFESVTTEAGTFNCAVITSDYTSKMAFITITSSSKEWVSPKAGQVMNETYDKNGKKISSRKLVEFLPGN